MHQWNDSGLAINPCQCGGVKVRICNDDAIGANGENREIFIRCSDCGCKTLPFLYKKNPRSTIRQDTIKVSILAWNRLNPISK